MIVTSAQHQKFEGKDTNVVKATIDGVEMQIPKDPLNRHYAAILKWVAEGNTIAEADQMESKMIIGVLASAILALVGWNIKTTHELTLSVQKLEIILQHEAFTN